MGKTVQKMASSFRKKQTPSFEECMATLSAHLAYVSPPLSPKSAFKENVMVFNSRTGIACIIDAQGNVQYTDLPKQPNIVE